MIPKKLHYCWFGRNPKPLLAKKCMKSWRKLCSDYEIIEWNEDNYDLSKAPIYVQQAYAAKKWAFVTDYVRLQVVYENGGIYLDTDVQLLKKLDPLLDNQAYFGFETEEFVATGLGFGAVQGLPILKELMEDYHNSPFVLVDGSFNLTPCPVLNTEVFLRHGLRQDNSMQVLDGAVRILPTEYLRPREYEPNKFKLTENTYSIHWYGGSWTEIPRAKQELNRILEPVMWLLTHTAHLILGHSFYEKIKSCLKKDK